MSTPFVKTPLRNRNRNQSQNNKEFHRSQELMDMRKKLNHERAKADDLEMDVKSKDAVIKKLNEENDYLKKRVRSLNDEMTTMTPSEVLDKLKAEFEEFKSKHEAVLADLKFSQNQVKDLEEELRASYNSNQELSCKFESAMSDMEKLAREFVDYTELKAKYEDLLQKLQVLSAENEELKQSLAAFKEQRKEELLNESSMYVPLNMVSSPANGEPVSLFTEMMNKDLELDLEKTKEEKEKLKLEVEELRNKVIGMEVLQQQVETLSSQLNHTKSRLSDSYRDLESCISKREADKKRATEQRKILEDKMTALENETLQMNQKYNELETSYSKLSRCYKELQNKNKEFTRKINELQDEIKVLDESFFLERKHKERYARENLLLERMLKNEQIRVSQSVMMPPPPPPSSSSSSSAPKMVPPPPSSTSNSARSSFYEDSTRTSFYDNSARSSLYDGGSRRPPAFPPGTGRALPMADEEGQFMDPRHFSDLKNVRCEVREVREVAEEKDPRKRLSILQERNSLLLPHLKSSYPVEMQALDINENAIKQGATKRPRATTFTISFKSEK